MRSKSYVGWTPSRDSKLRRNFNKGMNDKDLSTLFNCTEDAIKGRRSHLGLSITDRKNKNKARLESEKKAQAKLATAVKQAAIDFQPKQPVTPTAVVNQPKVHYKLLALVKGDVRSATTPVSADSMQEAAEMAKKILYGSPDVDTVEVIQTVAYFSKIITEVYEPTTKMV